MSELTDVNSMFGFTLYLKQMPFQSFSLLTWILTTIRILKRPVSAILVASIIVTGTNTTSKFRGVRMEHGNSHPTNVGDFSRQCRLVGESPKNHLQKPCLVQVVLISNFADRMEN